MNKACFTFILILFSFLLQGQKSISLCPGESGLDRCEHLNKLIEACEGHYKHLNALSDGKLNEKGPVEVGLRNNLPSLIKDLEKLKELIKKIDENNKDKILNLCDRIIEENYIARNWDKKSYYNVSLKDIIPETKKSVAAQNFKNSNNQNHDSNSRDNQPQLSDRHEERSRHNHSEGNKAADNDNQNSLAREEESIDHNHTNTITTSPSTKAQQEGDSREKDPKGGWRIYLLSFMLGFMIPLLMYFFHFKKVHEKKNSDLQSQINHQVLETNKLKKEIDEYKNKSTSLTSLKRERDSYEEKFLELKRQYQILKNQLTTEHDQGNFAEQTESFGQTIEFEMPAISKEIKYHYDVELDRKSLKVSKATNNRESNSTYELNIDGDIMKLSIIEDEIVTKMLLGFRKNKIESLFEVPYRPQVNVRLFHTKTPAKFSKSADGEYWRLEQKGELEFK